VTPPSAPVPLIMLPAYSSSWPLQEGSKRRTESWGEWIYRKMRIKKRISGQGNKHPIGSCTYSQGEGRDVWTTTRQIFHLLLLPIPSEYLFTCAPNTQTVFFVYWFLVAQGFELRVGKYATIWVTASPFRFQDIFQVRSHFLTWANLSKWFSCIYFPYLGRTWKYHYTSLICSDSVSLFAQMTSNRDSANLHLSHG
jgi:hypothetical protein